MSHKAILVEEEDVGGRHGNVAGADLAPLQPDAVPHVGFVDEIDEGLVLFAGDDDRVVTILFPDLFERFLEVHLLLPRSELPVKFTAGNGLSTYLRGAGELAQGTPALVVLPAMCDRPWSTHLRSRHGRTEPR